MFCESGAEGDASEPKKMYITKDKVAQALQTLGIEPREPGDGNIEFEIMDEDFRGIVRFKDFLKFVKKHAKGKAYESLEKYHDSTISSSDEEEQECREAWKEMDPERNCKVTHDRVGQYFEENFGKVKAETLPIIASDMDMNKDGMITYLEFRKKSPSVIFKIQKCKNVNA